mmetsp:Transcript_47646/g.137103  ORF Transcript_47646/g.137103 Transcript_47646/m.137103 type:complete len:527 (+) Transcript_47646:111-1691(+)
MHRGGSTPCLLGREREQQPLVGGACAALDKDGCRLKARTKRFAPAPLDGARAPFKEVFRLPNIQSASCPRCGDGGHGPADGSCAACMPSGTIAGRWPSSEPLATPTPAAPGARKHRARGTPSTLSPQGLFVESPPAPGALGTERCMLGGLLRSESPQRSPQSTRSGKALASRPLARKGRRCKTWAASQGARPPQDCVPLEDSGSEASCADSTPATCAPPSIAAPSRCKGPFGAQPRSSPEPRLPTVRGTTWRKGSVIGSGSYGCVYKAFDPEASIIFAVKQATFQESSDEDRSFRARLEAELDIYKQLRHPNIISYLGHHHQDDTLYIYLEYAPGGSVASVLRNFGALQEPLLQTAARGVLEGLHYLHTRDPPVVHRDIKGANILVDLSFCMKLADFGCSRRGSVTTSFTMIGSVPWMAPEVIQQQDGHGRKADVWSLGCTLIEMATAEKPWGNHAFENLMFALNRIGFSEAVPPIPGHLSPGLHELISSCIQRLPHLRPAVVDLLSSPYVHGPAPPHVAARTAGS